MDKIIEDKYTYKFRSFSNASQNMSGNILIFINQMNRGILYVFIGVFGCFTLLTSCLGAENGKKIPHKGQEIQYSCPMKCSQRIYDQPGKCSHCGMELIQITEG